MFLAIQVVSTIFGVILFSLMEVKVHLIWTSFTFLPIIISTFVAWYSIWAKNDYCIFEAPP